MTISFFANGEPKPQPRARAFARKMGNKFVARVYDAGTAEGWKAQVAMAARPYLPATPLTGPIKLDLTFYFPRPKGHYRTGKRASELREDSPRWHITKPDRDNSEKAIKDCLTQIGMWRDDCQVCAGEVRKFYTDGFKPGCQVVIEKLEEPTALVPTAKEGELTLR